VVGGGGHDQQVLIDPRQVEEFAMPILRGERTP